MMNRSRGFENEDDKAKFTRQQGRPRRGMGWCALACFCVLAGETAAVRSSRPPLTVASLNNLRGGSVKPPTSSKRHSRSGTSKLYKYMHDESKAKVPSIEALLIPRRLKLTLLVQWASLLTTGLAFFACVKTAGIPYAAAVWKLVHGADSSPPSAKAVSSIDQFLARRIVASSSEILPPRYLPSGIPLFLVLTSVFLGVTFSILLPRWFTSAHVFMTYHKEKLDGGSDTTKDIISSVLAGNLETSVLVNVPRDQRQLDSDGRSHVVRPLHASPPASKRHKDVLQKQNDHLSPHYFDLNNRRMYCDILDSSAPCLDGGPTLHSNISKRDLLSSNIQCGLCTKSKLQMAQQRFGPYASLSLPTPTVLSAFSSRISSPLAVLQLLGRLLSTLEEHFVSSLFGLVSTLFHHYWNARRSIVSVTELVNEVKGNVEDTSATTVWALRPTKGKKKRTGSWKQISAVELLPGDVFVLDVASEEVRSRDVVMPVDCLLLEGNCVMNEAVLTGESVPQSKVRMDLETDDPLSSLPLDIQGIDRGSVLFAGTSLLHCSPRMGHEHFASSDLPELPTHSVSSKCVSLLALRTGTYSSRGDLLRALAKSSGHVGAISSPQSEKDATRLILCLSACAAVACASLFQGNQQDHRTSSFRRLIQCTRIAIASIPSDLPLALSAIAHSCAGRIRKDADVVCSEPGSLLTAAHIDVCVFDKTGTLTADTQSLSSVVYPKSSTQAGIMADAVLAGCHSLVNVESEGKSQLVGDPLEQVSLTHAGWIYNFSDDAFVVGGDSGVSQDDAPVKLWQIKTFPFDSNRRMSSAIILVLCRNDQLRLWTVIKGSPDAIRHLLVQDAHACRLYKKQVASLESDGTRLLALAATELTASSEIGRMLFPKGFPARAENSALKKSVKKARQVAEMLHRSDFEIGGTHKSEGPLKLVGFACFDAATRPSTRRVINDLQMAGMKTIMLTGDATDAALAVAGKAGLISSEVIHILDVRCDNAGPALLWRTMRTRRRLKRNKRRKGFSLERDEAISTENVRLFLSAVDMDGHSFAMTGAAAEMLIADTSKGSAENLLRDNLHKVAVVARASPNQKRGFVTYLKEHCGKKVLMCGDGVNDVAAMKTADVAVAMLNGYGDETAEGQNNRDVEDENRLQNLSRKRLGQNRRKKNVLRSSAENIGIGNTATASGARVNAAMMRSMQSIRAKAAERQKEQGREDEEPVYNWQDIKDIASALFQAIREERTRARELKRGGGAAARILAEEDRQHRELLNSQAAEDSSHESDIKPGEASLAAAFSCLRPSISGVDTLLRVGVAASACALSIQQTIALNCLMSCFNLASLYRDGFRYGSFMWNIELFFYMSIDQATYQALCTPRPRLTSARLNESLFHSESTLLVFSQAFIHLMTLHSGVAFANWLEKLHAHPKKAPLVRWKDKDGTTGQKPSLIMTLAQSMLDSLPGKETGSKKPSGLNLLGRPPFQPNYATNFVLLMSIFQNAVSAITTHRGKPFYGSILESRQLCFSLASSILLPIVVLSETFPALSKMLELRLLPSRRHRGAMLLFFLIDIVGCSAAGWVSTRLWTMYDESNTELTNGVPTAAQEEERLLREEAEQNRTLLACLFLVASALMTNALSK